MIALKKHIVSFFLLFYCLGFTQSSSENIEIEFQTHKAFMDSVYKYSQIDISKSIHYSNLIITKAKFDKNLINEYNGYYAQQKVYVKNELYDEALKSIERMVTLSKVNNLDLKLFKSYQLKSLVLLEKGGAKEIDVLNNYYTALRAARKKNNKSWESKFLNGISYFYTKSKDYKNAINYKHLAISSFKNIDPNYFHQEDKHLNNDLTDYYLDLSYLFIETNIDSAIYYINKARPLLDNTHNKRQFQSYYFKKANIDLLQKKLELSQKHVDSALSIKGGMFKENKEFKSFISSYYNGKIAFQNQDFKKTISLFESISNDFLSRLESRTVGMKDFYKIFSKSYLYLGNIEKADFYFEKHLKNIENQNQLNYTINSKFKEIEIIEYNNELEQIKNKQQEQKKYLLYSILISSIIVIAFISYNYKEKKKNKEKFDLLIVKLEKKKNIESIKQKDTKVSLKINNEEVNLIIKKLELLEQEEYYLNIGCTLSNIAKHIDSNTSYLSKVVNLHFQKSFRQYINEYRINYALKRLKEDKLFRRYTIQSIANDIGFKSKESFNKAFRSQTGILPSYYIKQLEQDDS
jgi:AraC-like DNA-binding protein